MKNIISEKVIGDIVSVQIRFAVFNIGMILLNTVVFVFAAAVTDI